ncbi:MAG: ABC transporter substrate-binding protein [Deltaproteobacteria bacterium]|nr:ABC transporter substrate-binding protein [Candidatus Anaeroferrophillus wilburensis]MBN2888513.1 ABC transporter substrate-binding protein [Deltaproteobacteria bacterium]
MNISRKLVGIVVGLTILFVGSLAVASLPGKPIVLGCPLSTAFLYGWDAERGIKLAVEEINNAGGVTINGVGHPLQVEVIDTRDLEAGVPVSEALLGVEKLILEKKADFIVGGPVRSEAALAVMDLLNKYQKVSIVTTGVLSPGYHKRIAADYDKYKYCFRNSSEIITIGKDMIKVFNQLHSESGLKKAFIMVQDVAHARKAGGFIAKLLNETGNWEVLGEEIYPTGATDFSMGLLKARRLNAEVLFIWMDMPESAILLKQWKNMKMKCVPMGFMSAAEQPNFWEATNGNCEYTIVDAVNGGNVSATITPWTMKFVDGYKKKWGLEPEGYGASSSYMAVYQLKAAIEAGNSLAADDVIKGLENLDMMGVYGRMKFDQSHQIIPADDPQIGATGCIFQWQDGKRVQFFPKAGATGTIMLPPWMK